MKPMPLMLALGILARGQPLQAGDDIVALVQHDQVAGWRLCIPNVVVGHRCTGR